jgi:hypothetical protein
MTNVVLTPINQYDTVTPQRARPSKPRREKTKMNYKIRPIQTTENYGVHPELEPSRILFRGTTPECETWITAAADSAARNAALAVIAAGANATMQGALAAVPEAGPLWSALTAAGREMYNNLCGADRRAAAHDRAGMGHTDERGAEHHGNTAARIRASASSGWEAYKNLCDAKHAVAVAARSGDVAALQSAIPAARAALSVTADCWGDAHEVA